MAVDAMAHPTDSAGSLHVAVMDDYLDSALSFADWNVLQPRARVVTFTAHLGSAAEVVAALQAFDVVVAMRERTRFPAEVLERLPNLRLLVSTGQRNAAIDLEACARMGIAVRWAHAAPAAGNSTAEITWGLILSLYKHLPAQDAAVRAGRWQTMVAETVSGKVLGIMGLGRVGTAVARVGQAFGMQLIGWSPTLDRARALKNGVELVDRQTLFTQSDVLSLHLVLRQQTRGIVDRAALRSMQPGALLVNTARAGLIEDGALHEALRSGWIAGAGLDVFDHEPLAGDDPLCGMQQVVLSPHLGYATRENLSAFYRHAVQQIRLWIDSLH